MFKVEEKTIEIFLKQMVKELNKGHLRIVPRNLNIDNRVINYKQALFDLKIYTLDDLKSHLYSLKKYDCIRISNDYDLTRDENSEIFEFLKYINGIRTYIKLFLDKNGVVCLSFHRSKED